VSAGIADVHQIQPLPQPEQQVLHDLMTSINLENIGWRRDFISNACDDKSGFFTGLTCGDALLFDAASGLNKTVRIITELNLRDSALRGTIPSSIGNLLNLRELRIVGEGFTGTIPDTFASIPTLRTLIIGETNIEGTVPDIFHNKPFLINVEFVDNTRLRGTIPASLFGLPRLQNLMLNSPFEGTIPEAIGQLTSINFLGLRGTNFEGTIPAGINNLRNMLHLYISNNKQLTGSLPFAAEMPNLINVEIIDNPQFEGTLQDFVSYTPNIAWLRVHDSKFSGTIPSTIGQLGKLERFTLHNFPLSGTIPDSISNCRSLNYFEVSDTQLSGSIPNSLSQLSSMLALILSENRLEGTIPADILARGQRMIMLDLSDNKLSGTLSPQIGSMSQLQYLLLDGNQLVGTLPTELSGLTRASVIDLASNHFIGEVPSLYLMTRLNDVDLSDNRFSGPLPDFHYLPDMAYVRLRNNSFTGTIHPAVGTLRSLVTIDVSINQLSGTLPDLSNLPRLRHIDVSSNQFGGCVPQFAQIQIDKCLLLDNNFECCCTSLPPCTMLRTPCNYDHCNFPTSSPIDDDDDDEETPEPEKELEDYEVALAIIIPAATVVGVIFLAVYLVSRQEKLRHYRTYIDDEPGLSNFGVVQSSSVVPTIVNWIPPLSHKFVELDKLPIKLSKPTFTFDKEEGSQFEVLRPYLDSLTLSIRLPKVPPPKPLTLNRDTDIVELDDLDSKRNAADNKVYTVKFHFPNTYKYQFAIEPASVVVSKGRNADADAKLTMNMTTEVNIKIGIEIENLKIYSFLYVHAISQPSHLIDYDEVELESSIPIGEGSVGSVYRGKYRGLEVAVKQLKIKDLNTAAHEEFIRDVELMNKLRHSNIVQFIGASEVSGKLAILTEFIDGGNAGQLLLAQPQSGWKLRLRIALDAAKAIQFLHQNNVTHRDIKMENLMIISQDPSAPVVVKLADFGLRGLTHASLDAGTLAFIAPEILNKDPYHPKADVYSFGMVLWVIAAQKLPYQNLQHPRDIIAHVTSGRREIIPRDCPGDLASLIKQCWAQNPDERPDFSLIVRELQMSQ
jgi:tRNA A-37 threonylcarbamoyl transferase component Bud32